MNNKPIIKTLSITAIVLSSCAIILSVFTMATKAPKDYDKQYKNIVKKHYQVFSPIIPEQLVFCGDTVPLDNILVRDALDRELTTIMYHHSTTFLIMKRANRFFPIIEPILKKEGVPEDIKYLAVAESGLDNVISPAKAEGFWQFMPQTAKEYGLRKMSGWDERYDLEKATIAACQYLKEKKEVFGNWPMTCASYNCGERGLKRLMKQQGKNNYWQMLHYAETSRYVFRIIAYKIILENPQTYGYNVRNKDLYQPIATKDIIIDSTVNNIFSFADSLNVNYKVLRTLNPQIRDKKIINKQRHKLIVKLPVDNQLSWQDATKKLNNKEKMCSGF